jgi:hypothetical protein
VLAEPGDGEEEGLRGTAPQASGDLDRISWRAGLDDPKRAEPVRRRDRTAWRWPAVRMKRRHAVSKAAGIVIEKSSVLVLPDAAQRQQTSADPGPTRGNSTATTAP